MSAPYGYAWNAEIVCEDCVRARLIAVLKSSSWFGKSAKSEIPFLGIEELSTKYAKIILGHDGPLGDLDTAVFPQPSWDPETLTDSCGSCLTKIEETL